MMRKVFKYPIRHREPVTLPARHKVVLVGKQGDGVLLWAEVDTDAPDMVHEVLVLGTGQDLGDDRFTHAGSFQEWPFVWHVYLGPGTAPARVPFIVPDHPGLTTAASTE